MKNNHLRRPKKSIQQKEKEEEGEEIEEKQVGMRRG